MLFNSLEFLIFFPIVTFLYFFLPFQFRTALLLISSCVFYMALIPKYILILFYLIVIDYFAGILIENAKGKKRKIFLIVSLVVNIGTLAFFKYFNFIAENLNLAATAINGSHPFSALQIILPIGLSFHTFQSMSYTIEVYKGNVKAEKNFWRYALFVMFYVQLVAGPIERPQHLLLQFKIKHRFDWNKFKSGLKLMGVGFYKKIFIADILALIVDPVFNNTSHYTGWSLILAVYAFTIQIYCDFSGYTDIARGCARVMGFELMQNFNQPYLSKSVGEFWRRWHISLSTWFRDYLYIPLGGNKGSKTRVYFNIMLVFLISGFWHGASWTFIVWGFIHGIYLTASLALKPITLKMKKAFLKTELTKNTYSFLTLVFTFNLVAFAWIFFRANSMKDALYIVDNLFNFKNGFDLKIFFQSIKASAIGIPLISILIWIMFQTFKSLFKFEKDHFEKHFSNKWVKAFAFAAAILIFIQWSAVYLIGLDERDSSRPQQFIYFQF